MIINKHNLLENLNNTYCTFGQSKVHGIGVVAIRDIPKDIDPFPPLMSEQSISITEEDLEPEASTEEEEEYDNEEATAEET